MKLFRFEYEELLLRREEIRRLISDWLKILFIFLVIVLVANFRGTEIFTGLMLTIICGNIALFIALVVKETNKGLNKLNRVVADKLKEKINQSIKKEEEFNYNQIDQKFEEYQKRNIHYEYLLNRIKFQPLRNIILSTFLAISFLIICGLFKESINKVINITFMPLQHINLILAGLFLSALYYFLIALLFIALSFLGE